MSYYATSGMCDVVELLKDLLPTIVSEDLKARIINKIDYMTNGETLFSTWHIDDVKQVAEDNELEVTEKQCINVLERVARRHDASIGINWEVIEFHLQDLLSEE